MMNLHFVISERLYLTSFNFVDSEKGTKFIEDGVRELLKARRVLCGSYVYGYYLEDDGYNKTIFEFMQVILISIVCIAK